MDLNLINQKVNELNDTMLKKGVLKADLFMPSWGGGTSTPAIRLIFKDDIHLEHEGHPVNLTRKCSEDLDEFFDELGFETFWGNSSNIFHLKEK